MNDSQIDWLAIFVIVILSFSLARCCAPKNTVTYEPREIPTEIRKYIVEDVIFLIEENSIKETAFNDEDFIQYMFINNEEYYYKLLELNTSGDYYDIWHLRYKYHWGH